MPVPELILCLSLTHRKNIHWNGSCKGVSFLAVPTGPFAQTTSLSGGPAHSVPGELKDLGRSFRENTDKARGTAAAGGALLGAL